MTTMRRLATPAALLALLPLLLSACSDEEKPRPPIVSSSSPTPTPSPTQTATVPADESPEDFIRRWIEAGDAMQADGNTKPYRELTLNCEACDGFADEVDEIFATGGSIETDGIVVKAVDPRGRVNDIRSFKLSLQASSTTVRDATSKPVRTLEGGAAFYLVELKRIGDVWRVISYGKLDK